MSARKEIVKQVKKVEKWAKKEFKKNYQAVIVNDEVLESLVYEDDIDIVIEKILESSKWTRAEGGLCYQA